MVYWNAKPLSTSSGKMTMIGREKSHSNSFVVWSSVSKKLTLWKTDMEHENGGLEDNFPVQLGDS